MMKKTNYTTLFLLLLGLFSATEQRGAWFSTPSSKLVGAWGLFVGLLVSGSYLAKARERVRISVKLQLMDAESAWSQVVNPIYIDMKNAVWDTTSDQEIWQKCDKIMKDIDVRKLQFQSILTSLTFYEKILLESDYTNHIKKVVRLIDVWERQMHSILEAPSINRTNLRSYLKQL